MKKNSLFIIMGLLLLISIAFNISLNNSVKEVDIAFVSKLDSLNSSLKFFNENTNLQSKIRNSSSQSGSVLALYKLTSYFNKNKSLFGTLNELNLAFINLPEDKLLKNISKISDYIVKIRNNPEDVNISDEFNQFIFEIGASE